MREGEHIICPHCQGSSVVKIRMDISGWSVQNRVYACAFCNAELGKVNPKENEAVPEKSSSSALAALLGSDVETSSGIRIKAEAGDEKVCRNCRHFAVHPFKNVCLITQLEVDTMDDCNKFELKERG